MTISRRTGAALALAAVAWVSPDAPARAQNGASAGDSRPIILAVGESTTAGYGVPRDLSYPSQLQQELDARGYRYRVVNQGVSGSTTNDALARLSRGMSLLPKIVVIALGGNDAGNRVPIATTRANMSRLIGMYRRVGAVVIVANRNLPGDDGRDATSMFAELAAEHGAVLMPPLLSGVEGRADLLIGDGRHPNAEGYRIVVANLLPVLQPFLSEGTLRARP
jgi:acyl-CoA thioesterase-1